MQHLYIPVIVLCPELTSCFMTYDDYYKHAIVLLLWGQPELYESDDGDIGYMVYRWVFPYLDYPLNVSISWIHNLSLYD